MNKDIRYTTISHQPSDYEAADGELSTAIGTLMEDGSLKPLFPPKEILRLAAGESVRCVHQTSYYKHYIVLSESGTLSWIDSASTTNDKTALHTFTMEVYRITAIGNTLVCLTADGMHYFLWKDAHAGYLDLGTQIPDITIGFGLDAKNRTGDTFTVEFNKIPSGDIWNTFTDENKSTITSAVLAQVNKFIADEATHAGKFIFPFFVRYAYRLYDQTLTHHSAPILMLASAEISPTVNIKITDESDSYNKMKMSICAFVSRLVICKITNLDSLKSWTDIISSIDIFISAPIYTYDESGECTKFVKNYDDTNHIYSVCRVTNTQASGNRGYGKWPSWYYTTPYVAEINGHPHVKLPGKSDEAIQKEISNCSNFYFLKSFKTDELQTGTIEIPDDYLEALVTREAMTDDYDSHDLLIPKYVLDYNSRLNIANLSKRLFPGYHAWAQFTYTDSYIRLYQSDEDHTGTENTTVYFYLRQDGREIVVKHGMENGMYGSFGYATPFLYLYYPNTNAYKAVLEVVSENRKNHSYYEVPLKPHAFLNGAYYFDGWKSLTDAVTPITAAPILSGDAGRTIDVENKIYTSGVNNPYLFPLSGINTVGTGRIIALSTAAKALSQGQFGQFPLYAFSCDGVWALEVSTQGTYTAKQPITRDVCLSEDSITQLDNSVLFATARGVMLISGSQTQCITDTLNARSLFSLASLPRAEGLVKVYNNRCPESERIQPGDLTHLDFPLFTAASRMVYDYTHQHIILYVPGIRYAYVYSLKSKAWGMIQSRTTQTIPSYPNALAMAM
ncbi:MAG: hypothetical protein LUC18_04830, partial [Porphyromonadaceae bacterium]|nr:hypothetical protein [Porphyromonadaceae bacterium]